MVPNTRLACPIVSPPIYSITSPRGGPSIAPESLPRNLGARDAGRAGEAPSPVLREVFLHTDGYRRMAGVEMGSTTSRRLSRKLTNTLASGPLTSPTSRWCT